MGRHVVVDLEMCKVTKIQRTKEFKLGSEIIQIGAVLLDDDNNEIDSFSTYVKPAFGRLNNFITNLTGITEYDLKDAPLLESALTEFMEWVPNDAIAVSWSHSDDNQIRKEVLAKNIDIVGLSELLDSWEDCQATFSEKMNAEKAYNLTEALNIADIYYEDGAHDGLVDAKNTALLYAKMEREAVLTLNKYYVEATTEKEDDDFGLDWTKILSGLVFPEASAVAV